MAPAEPPTEAAIGRRPRAGHGVMAQTNNKRNLRGEERTKEQTKRHSRRSVETFHGKGTHARQRTIAARLKPSRAEAAAALASSPSLHVGASLTAAAVPAERTPGMNARKHARGIFLWCVAREQHRDDKTEQSVDFRAPCQWRALNKCCSTSCTSIVLLLFRYTCSYPYER